MTKALLAGAVATLRRSVYWPHSKFAAVAIVGAGTLMAAMATDAIRSTPAYAAPICYSGGIVKGDWHHGVIKKRVAKRARKSWGDAAQKAAGTSRARTWAWAVNRNVLCDKSNGIWHCNASARPCF